MVLMRNVNRYYAGNIRKEIMSERAYSTELKRIISANEAVRLSKEGKLKDRRAFKCCDIKCRIDLTCSNWMNVEGKRKYYLPSRKDELHALGCDEVNKKEERKQVDGGVKRIEDEAEKNGIVIMLTSPDRNTKEKTPNGDVDKLPARTGGNTYKRNGEYRGKKYEGQRASRLETFVELYKREDIDHAKKMVSINGKMYSLNELFISSDTTLEDGTFGIFFGKAIINTSFKSDVVEITFCGSSFPKIYTNINSLKRIRNGLRIKELIDTNETFEVYFRGTFANNTLNAYNDRFFKDLSFEIEL